MTGQLVLELAPPPAPTLQNYVAGQNGAAVAALRALATTPGAVYLWGERGCGRSHLLEAAVQAARDAGRTAALVRAGMDAMPPPHAPLALIAIDDVDALDAAGQVAAFDLFNAARARGASFIAAGNAAPQQIGAREDLRTRLASGLTFELRPLDEAEKRAALRSHAASRGMALGEDVVSYLLTRLRRDLATQLAVLDALDRYSLAHKRALTLPLVREAVEALALR
jgi:DnaA family protein